jgi:hypothetical protein
MPAATWRAPSSEVALKGIDHATGAADYTVLVWDTEENLDS